MLYPRIKETTTANIGTGNITGLTSVTGFVTFDNGPGQGQHVPYYLLDDTANIWEQGWGYLSAATTFVRDKVLATSTTPTGTTSAVAFSNTNTKTLILNQTSSDTYFSPPSISTNGNYDGVVSAHLSLTVERTSGITATRYGIQPFLLLHGGSFVNIAAEITTAGTSAARMRIAIYHVNESGNPGHLIEESAEINASTTGLKVSALASTIFLTPGWYYTAFQCNESLTMPAIDANTGAPSPLGLYNITRPYTKAYTGNLSYRGSMAADLTSQSFTWRYDDHPAAVMLERS